MEDVLASRYARALGEIAQEKGILDRVYSEIEILADISMPDRGDVSVPELLTFLHAPRIPLEDKIKLTDVMLEKMKFTEEVGSLLNILIRRGRVNLVGNIANNLRKRIAALKNVTVADLESAVPLKDNELKEIQSALESRLNGKVDIRSRIKPELIGGLRVRIGDQLIDGSITGRLERLESSLKQ
jgi:F-type H+-transporting ATPase subunit delta